MFFIFRIKIRLYFSYYTIIRIYLHHISILKYFRSNFCSNYTRDPKLTRHDGSMRSYSALFSDNSRCLFHGWHNIWVSSDRN